MAGTVRNAQREATRVKLLNAAVGCLLDDGYARTTNQRIQERAGVSRGALLHHFPRKSELLVAAIHRIADDGVDRLAGIADGAAPGPDGFRVTVRAIREAMSGPPFLAAMELWAAARTDEELRRTLLPAERRLGQALRALLMPHLRGPGSRTEADGLLALLRGLALTQTMKQDPVEADAILTAWVDRLIAAGAVPGAGGATPGREA
jgi:AcrR family transcriptional regulator